MLVLELSVLIWCYALVSGQTSGRVISFSHPESSLPLTSGLVQDAPSLPTSVIDLVTARNHGNFARFSSAAVLKGLSHTCDTFLTKLFRRADGACNNQDTRGQSLMPLARFMPPEYGDGVQSPRSSSVLSDTLALPSPRAVSRWVHRDLNATTQLSIFVMQWGQFMDHEMVSTPLPIEDTRGVIECCGPNGGPPLGNESSECLPIRFSPGDPNFQGTCTSFVRSQPFSDPDGNIILPRENINLITAFIDGSVVYGSTLERQDELRDSKKRYLLRTTEDDFPPDNGLEDCIKRDANDICFLAGDDRVNELPGLTLLHTVFLRYHNILARSLRRSSPFASDEFVFQQVRAIVGAVIQKILYSDWLPIVLGPNVRKQYKLDLEGGPTRHDPDKDPRIFTSFSTAVFRFGHTLIPRSLPISPSRRPLLRELFFKPFETRENLDTLADGLAQSLDFQDRSQPADRFLVAEVTGHLFENQEGERKGFDLAALNIQRGRDHGLPSYNTFREILGLGRLNSFRHPALGSAGYKLQQVYADVNDIDLFPGGMSEPVHDGGLVGETFSNLMAIQLNRLKFGDRFFFNNERKPFGFTRTQVRLIRRVSLSTVLCLTTNLHSIQTNVFRIPSRRNRRVPCSKLVRQHPGMKYFINYPYH
ncbi:chorion peroxidase-like [Babylonia areolata]|uniref:chorion peroxidase-like n=1 Tax=Babylonia areolata TaxID=304850 RepID=UPI003FCF7E6A